MTDETTMRRAPQQQRGQQRVEKILNAAAEVFAEVGYEHATTNAIAARAKTAIGSLYQYFPNKEAIFAALAERYKDELHSRFLEVEAISPSLSLPEVLMRLADAIAGYYLANPGFQAIFQLSDDLNLTGNALHEAIIAAVERILAPHTQQMTAQRRHICAQVITLAFKPLLIMVVAAPADEREALRAEIRLLAQAYAREIEDRA